MQLKNCASLRKFSKSATVPVRRPPSRSEQLGALATVPKLIEAPPMRQIVRRIAGVEHEARRRRPKRALDQLAGKGHPAVAHLGTGRLQAVAGLRQHHLHADLAQHLERGLVDALDLVGRQQIERRERQRRPPLRALGNAARGGGLAGAAAATAVGASMPLIGCRRIGHVAPFSDNREAPGPRRPGRRARPRSGGSWA